MAVTVTMLQTRRGEDGNLWTAGSTQSATDAFAQFLISSNLATGTLPAVPQSGLSPADSIAVKSLVSGAGNGVSFLGKFLGSAVPTVGPVPTWATNSGATGIASIVDYLGNVRYCKQGEARFWGARRVENLLRASNAFTNATYWTVVGTATIAAVTTDAARTLDTDGASFKTAYLLTSDGTTSNVIRQTLGVLPGVKHTVSVEVWAGTSTGLRARLYVTAGATAGEMTVSGGADGWVRYAFTATPDGASTYQLMLCTTSAGTVYIRKAQVENMGTEVDDASGNRPPSGYVSQDEIVYSTGQNTPYHGAFVDGVRYEVTTNGNTLNNATKVVTEAAGADLPESQLLGLWIEEQDTNLVTNGATLSGWTINASTSVALTTGQASPDGLGNAVLLTEDAAFTSKFVQLTGTLSDNSQSCAFALFKRPASNPQQFARIDIKKKDGTTVVASFDLVGGVLGNESTVIAAGGRAYMVQLGATGWWLCALTVNVGTGGTTPEHHFGLMATATGTSYTGTSKGMLIWNPHFIAKEHPCTFIKPAAAAQTRTGYAIDINMNRVVGRNNFAVYFEMHPLYDTGAANKTSDGVAQSWYYPMYMRAAVPDQAHYRLGQSIRPFADVTLGYSLFAQDRYNGNVVQAYKWQASTYYPVGAWVVPTDTQVDNANGKRQFYNFVAGTSGAIEPTWDTTWVSPPDGGVSDITVDGDCRWQANHQNRISGNFENYDGFLTLARSGFMQTCRVVNWWSDAPDMGSAVNGVIGYRQTEPFPILPSEPDGSLVKLMDHLRLGRASTTYAVSSQGFRFLTIWDNPPDNNAATWVPLSATGELA